MLTLSKVNSLPLTYIVALLSINVPNIFSLDFVVDLPSETSGTSSKFRFLKLTFAFSCIGAFTLSTAPASPSIVIALSISKGNAAPLLSCLYLVY